jgi:hypothetical protein
MVPPMCCRKSKRNAVDEVDEGVRESQRMTLESPLQSTAGPGRGSIRMTGYVSTGFTHSAEIKHAE